MNVSALLRAGINYEAGITRFLGDAALYEEVLRAFLSDTALERAQAAFASNDHAALFAAAHETKGSSGNADMTDLFEASCDLVALLREPTGNQDDLRGAFSQFEQAYQAAREGIRTALLAEEDS